MSTDPLIGQHLDEYRLLSLLGKGGMARVYLGLDVRLKRYVSIKVIDTPFRTDPSYVRRFQLEAQAVAQLEHPNIVRLYRYGEARGLLYMAMQYIEGADLDSMLESYRANGDFIPPQDAGRIIRELCLALDYAHDRGVVHRDVKPSNVILDRQGHPYLTDFGLALFAEPETREQVFGTPHFMAPEQVGQGGGATPLSDLYAVGIILYQMFTGDLPFDDPDPMSVARMQVTQRPRPPRDLRPAISPEVQAVILKAMAKAPGDRYPSGTALADALDRALAAVPAGTMAPLPTLPYLSIPDRVTVELTRHPPPALPPVERAAGSGAEIPRRDAPLPRRPSSPGPHVPAITPHPRPVAVPPRQVPIAVPPRPRRRRALGRTIGCLVAIFIVLALTAGAYWVVQEGAQAINSWDWSWLTRQVPWLFPPTSTPAGLPPDASGPATVATAVPQPTAEPSATPSPEPTAAPVPITYQLATVKAGEDSLMLINRSDRPFPMSPLRLGDGEGAAIQGSDWGIDPLPPDGCVVAIKGGPRPQQPKVNCTRVTDQVVTRRKADVFWKDSFNVYYFDQLVATCDKERCQFEVTLGQ